MKKFKFKRIQSDGVIIVKANINNKCELRLAVDTAATHTTIDSNMLFVTGIGLRNSLGHTEIETSNGIIGVDIQLLKSISAIGIEKDNFPIQVYDFVAHGITSNYDGVLGLDFFAKHHFCINLQHLKFQRKKF